MSSPAGDKKALVTGGAGFIGSHLAELLLEQGWEVWALDDLSTGVNRNVERLRDNSSFHLVVDSILSRSVVSELVHRVDVVYHLAAAVGVRLIVEQPVHTMVTNVQGTETVLEYCNNFGKRVFIASSSEVYGDHREERPLHEDDRRVYGPVTERRWLYADSKAMDEFLALAFHQERELDCVIGRFFNTVGPRQQRPVRDGHPSLRRAGARRAAARDARRRAADALLLPRAGHDPRRRRADGQARDRGRDLQHRLRRAREHPRARRARPRGDRLDVGMEFIPHDQVYGLGIEDVLHREPSIEKINTAIGWKPTLDLDRILADVVEGLRAAP